MFKIRCYTCEKLGHYSFQCPHGKGKRKHHAHAADMEDPSSQKKEKESKDEGIKGLFYFGIHCTLFYYGIRHSHGGSNQPHKVAA